jgi:hypothetical protein
MARNNFISSMKKQYGDNWIVALTPENIQKQSKRIARDMVLGNIDYETDGKYFYDGKFIDNLILGLDTEIQLRDMYFNALSFYHQYYPGYEHLAAQITHESTLAFIYRTINARLVELKYNDNVGVLYDIKLILGRYANHMN